jgi:hypothetical protein
MSNKTVKIDRLTAEFMLDLPEGTTITGARLEGTHIYLELDTELEFPENATLVYDHDEFGNTALVGAD